MRWVKLYDRLKKWEWYKDSTMVHIFINLLLSANYADGRWRGQEVKRGQLITGRKLLHQETGISEQRIRTALRRLVESQEITIESTKRFSLITILNYDKYQAKNEYINQKSNQQPTNNQPTTNHIQEEEEEEIEETEIIRGQVNLLEEANPFL